MGLFNMLFGKQKQPQAFCSVIVVAAGRATRMEGVDKVLCPLGGTPLLLHALAPLQASELVDEIVIVTREDLMVTVGALCSQQGFSKVRRLVKGGEERMDSVQAGLQETDPAATLIAIHDGARPFVTVQVIEDAAAQAAASGAAAPAVPVKDTVKEARDGLVERTLERERLYAVQTPQVFDADLIRAALQKALDDGVQLTDDCAAVERLGMRVALTPGDERNIKLTTPVDLLVGEALAEEAVR